MEFQNKNKLARPHAHDSLSLEEAIWLLSTERRIDSLRSACESDLHAARLDAMSKITQLEQTTAKLRLRREICICLPAAAVEQEPAWVKDLDPRPNGEPGPAMTQVYFKEFSGQAR